MPDRSSVNQLILQIHAAAEDPARWQTFLEGFHTALGSAQSALNIYTSGFVHNSVTCYTGATEADRLEYEQRWAALDPWMSRARQDAPAGVICRSHEITPDEVLEPMEIYQQYLLPRGWHYGCGVILLRSEALFSILSTTRPKQRGPITDAEVEWISQFIPHLQVAARQHERLTRLTTERDAAQKHLDLLPHGLALVGPEGYLLLANRRMQDLLTTGDGLKLRGQQFSAAGSVGKEIASWLQEAQTGRAQVRRFIVERPSIRRSYWVTASPIIRAGAVPLGGMQPIATITVVDPDNRVTPDTSALIALFGLTPAEVRLAMLLTSGLTVQEASDRLFISAETAKTHLKRILSKTGTRRQSEMVSLLLSVGATTESALPA